MRSPASGLGVVDAQESSSSIAPPLTISTKSTPNLKPPASTADDTKTQNSNSKLIPALAASFGVVGLFAATAILVYLRRRSQGSKDRSSDYFNTDHVEIGVLSKIDRSKEVTFNEVQQFELTNATNWNPMYRRTIEG